MTTILIADDSKPLRGAFRHFCENQNDLRVVGEAGDGTEAVREAVRLWPDVIVLDLRMPHLNGIETALILKRRLPSAYLILFTLYDESLSARLSTIAGVDRIVSKSEGISELLRVIRERPTPSPPCGDAARIASKARTHHG